MAPAEALNLKTLQAEHGALPLNPEAMSPTADSRTLEGVGRKRLELGYANLHVCFYPFLAPSIPHKPH